MVHRTISRIASLCILVGVTCGALLAQRPSTLRSPDEEKLIDAEIGAFRHRTTDAVASAASSWLDVLYYRLNLRITGIPQYLSGDVTVRGVCGQSSPGFLVLDLTNTMQIDSVTVDGRRAGFNQQASSFSVTLDSNYRVGDLITADVFYSGTPVATALGSFIFTSHNGTPLVWSLSEPYGARDWWPCKDHPSDKADSADIIVTCDSSFRVGSNGKLTAVIDNLDGTKTFHWEERYPIATYLISVALTNYAQFSNWFHYTATESLEVLNYVLPENLVAAQLSLPSAVDGLRIFSDLFGLYPFINEKYGHSQFTGGAMEHQTMTSTSTFDEDVITHELAHQWFGDMITCASWSHLWLNEGFATYGNGLYREKKYGVASYRSFMTAHLNRARGAAGPVYVRDTSDVIALFNGARVYSKGAAVLHMMRHVMGDSLFFKSMYAYANTPSLRYSSATTEDFQRVCEQTSGMNLGYLFNEWIYGENYPHYVYRWHIADSGGVKVLKVTINQSTGTSSPAFFTMPVDLRIVGPGWDSTITVFNNAASQSFSFLVPTAVESLQLDPGGWILKTAIDGTTPAGPSDFVLSQNYPNPFNVSTTIAYRVPRRAEISLDVFNVLGERVATLFSGTRTMGSYAVDWSAAGMPSGVYYCRLKVLDLATSPDAFIRTKAIILLK